MKNEILKCLKKSNSEDWLLIEPHLLYLDDSQAQHYLNAMDNEDYSGGFHSETNQILEKYKEKILGNYSEVNLVDLGPGFPDKSLVLAKYFEDKGPLNYFPVDVSKHYLEISKEAIQKYCNTVTPIQSLFENLPKKNEYPKNKSTFVMLGLTFMNFNSDFILSLLKQIAGYEGKIIIAAELLNKGTKEILAQYKVEEAKKLSFGPLKALGVSPNQCEYEVRFQNKRVELTFLMTDDFQVDDQHTVFPLNGG